MKKLLTLLWVIILGGAIVISIHLFKPDSKEEKVIIYTTPIAEENEKKLKPPSKKADKTFMEYIEIGDAAFTNTYYEKAIESYEIASEINPSSVETLMKLGEAYLKNNQNEEAKESFKLAKELSPENIQIELGIVRSEIALRNFNNAQNLLEKMDQDNPEVKYYHGIIFVLIGKYDDAKNNFEFISKLEKNNYETLIAKAEKFLEKFQTFSLFIETDNSFLKVLLSQALTEVGEFSAAIPVLFEVLNKQSNYRDAWIILGYDYLSLNENKEAIDAFSQANTLAPDNPKVSFFLGLAYFADNQLEKAIHYLEKADEQGYEPKDQLNLKLGDIYTLQKQYDKADTSYQEVLKLNKNDLQVFTRAIWINIDKINNAERALELAKIAIANHPEEAMSYNLAGWAYTAMGEYKKGKQNLDKALIIDPKLDVANLNLGWLYEKKGSINLAKEYYKRAYILAKSNSIGNSAAIRFNKLNENELKNYYKTNIASP